MAWKGEGWNGSDVEVVLRLTDPWGVRKGGSETRRTRNAMGRGDRGELSERKLCFGTSDIRGEAGAGN